MTAIVFLVLLAGHLLGDWVAQNDWQATNKTRSWAALTAHVASYHLLMGLLLLIPILVITFLLVHGHYEEVAAQLSLDDFSPPPPMTNTVLVLVGDMHKGVVRAIQYAQTLSPSAKAVYVEESLNRYVVALLRHTRTDSRLYLGASPRAGIALLRVAKARALVAGRDYIKPDDVKAVAPAVLAHRLIVAPEARSAGLGPDELVHDALERTPVPV